MVTENACADLDFRKAPSLCYCHCGTFSVENVLEDGIKHVELELCVGFLFVFFCGRVKQFGF
jgi:hypothetical protein